MKTDSGLKLFLKLNQFSQSELARLAQVSRQAVSKWFLNSSQLGLEPLWNISKNTGVPIDALAKLFMHKSVLFETLEAKKKELMTDLLWDKLYPSLDAFFIALANNEMRAIARLVQVYGLFESAQIVRKSRKTKQNPIWAKFHEYKKYIHPVRRKELDKLWTIQKNLRLI